MDDRKIADGIDQIDRLTQQYKNDFPETPAKPATKQICNEETGVGCNIMGGLRRRKSFKRKSFKRKSFKRKTSRRKSRRSK